ncbi:MAG: iron-containing alcohol dehydrogenase [Siphonobacter aquaeclarae]|nr:iron-containing alcohol dehydrogenase [Siphonobacter aquaeclarae]
MQPIYFPGKLVVGPGTLAQLADDVRSLAPSKVFLLTIPPLVEAITPLIQALEDAGRKVRVDTGIAQEPSFGDFHRLLAEAESFGPDAVLGIGGGSVLDVAKLVAAMCGNEQRLEEVVGNGLLRRRTTRLICVPATSGTGSEVSPNAILIDDADHQKKGIISPFLVPDVVYVDPLLTVSVPPAITAATGLDALTHCLEAYTNRFAQPLVDGYALDGIRRIAAHLVQAVRDGSDIQARSEVALGSLLGGFCLGPVNTAAVHALAYPLGTSYQLPHGLSNALLLPYVMAYNVPAAESRYADVARALGCPEGLTIRETAEAGIDRVRELVAACGIPARLRDAGVLEEDLPALAGDALKIQRLLKNNPREITLADAVSIYQAAF